jgi:hypothetical protein
MTTISVLQCPGGQVVTKTWTLDGVKGYDKAYRFMVHPQEVGDILELERLLRRFSTRQDCMIIRGFPCEGIDLTQPVLRRMHPHKDDPRIYFEERDGQPWFLLDIDKIPIPQSVDPAADPEGAINWIVENVLKDTELQDTTFCFQWSASSGMTSPDLLSVHLWFWLDRPMTDVQLKAWFYSTELPDRHGDPALFRCVQPHFVGNPLFKDGIPDPLKARIGLRRGAKNVATLTVPPAPEQGEPTQRTRSKRQAVNGGSRVGWDDPVSGFEANLALMGDGDGLRGFHRPITSARASFVATHGKNFDKEWLKEKIREAIRAAPKRTGRDVAYYLSDEYLDQSIDSAIEFLGDDAEERIKARECTAEDFPPLSPEELLGSGEPTGESGKSKDRFSHLRVLSRRDYRDLKPPSWLVADLIPESGVGVMIGPRQSFKSFVALDLSIAVALGRSAFCSPAHAALKPAHRIVSIYCGGEGAYGVMTQRVPAYEKAFGVSLDDAMHFVVPGVPLVASDDQVKMLIVRVREKIGSEPATVFVVLDTLNKMSPGLDPNDPVEMGRVISTGQSINEAFGGGGFTLILCHPKKDDQGEDVHARGSGAIEDDADATFTVTKSQTVRGCFLTRLKVTKLKDAEEGLVVYLKGENIPLALDHNERPVSSLVFRAITQEEFDRLAKGGMSEAIEKALKSLKAVHPVETTTPMLAAELHRLGDKRDPGRIANVLKKRAAEEDSNVIPFVTKSGRNWVWSLQPDEFTPLSGDDKPNE